MKQMNRLFPVALLSMVPAFFAQTVSAQTKLSQDLPTIVSFAVDKAAPAPRPLMLSASTQSKSGRRLEINDRYLILDGLPWLPVMGEFQYSRFPEKEWEAELLKMKAAGVQIIATYVFWNHHEELEGEFDWSGRRNLREFAELCKKHGLFLFVRIGPYVHGESRHGGLPDWVVEEGPVRRNTPRYLSHVHRFFAEVSEQLEGLLWKRDGPVIGIQLENEYFLRGPDAGAAHISALKKLALEAGLDKSSPTTS
jgi:hypothetical protein